MATEKKEVEHAYDVWHVAKCTQYSLSAVKCGCDFWAPRIFPSLYLFSVCLILWINILLLQSVISDEICYTIRDHFFFQSSFGGK